MSSLFINSIVDGHLNYFRCFVIMTVFYEHNEHIDSFVAGGGTHHRSGTDGNMVNECPLVKIAKQ